MSKYKMLCLDIDGTLLNSMHKISKETKEKINAAANQGIIVVLVSARMPEGIVYLQEELGVEQPIICYSGSLILGKGGDILLNKFIPSNIVDTVYNFTEEMNVHMSLYKDDKWYIKGDDEWSKQESDITHIVPNVTDFIRLLDEWKKYNLGPNKILCMSDPDNINVLNRKVSGKLSSYVNVYPSKATYLEIMPKSSSKTSAIEYLSTKLNISRSEIIAIGDNYNDVDMIQYAGLGIAMGNAPDKVKDFADDVTLTNDDNGVAAAIEKYIIFK
ncbi:MULTISPECIES: Cof-type HAD-IIB family hydrolase [Clostridium]|uniref:Cof-type HAD-IIB family hydrolase n=1 Tax=Clostridium TaxID=1485 RepID=UPI000825A0B9|nr:MULTISPECIES: Cof-type HAD-IIB family hydrolase [Clostridium]PJI07469.1 Cof-type HAD-IIB family hydrolase [Clostridium sp. CT7]